VDAVQLDYLLLDLGRDVRHDVLVEERVVLLFRLPDFGYAEALGILERDVEHEAGLLLDQLDQLRRDLVVLRRSDPGGAVPNQDSHSDPPSWTAETGPLHIRSFLCLLDACTPHGLENAAEPATVVAPPT